MARDVMLVGSVPLNPATRVFECACEHGLNHLMPRIPDGEQGGWTSVFMKWMNHPALEAASEPIPITRRPTTFFGRELQLLRLKPGHSVEELIPDELGMAKNAAPSYEEFKQAKAAGTIAPDTRFVVTLAGPGSSMHLLNIPHQQLFPMASRAYRDEIARILKVVPAEELAIQLDLAGEVECEEIRRRPEAFDLPTFERTLANWPFEETFSMIAEIADAVPPAAELGFHLCAVYHIDQSQGQDLQVHVDCANALTQKIHRVIDYIHMPTAADYTEADFAPLASLKLNPKTELYIGLIHVDDGVEGAVRRARAAAKVRPNFGIAAFCGLAQPNRNEYQNPHTPEEIFEMHRQVAEAT